MSRNSVYILIGTVFGLMALGLVMLLSVSAFAPDNRGNAVYFLTRQSIWLSIGIAVAALLAYVDYRVWLKHIKWLVIVGVGLMVLTLVPGLSRAIKGAHRWLDLGPVHIQPSELLKIAFISFLAVWLGKAKTERFKEGFGIPVVGLLIVVGLLVLQPDLGTSALLITITFLMMFVAGTKYRYILPLPVIGLLGILLIAMAIPERRARLLAFMNPEQYRMSEGYQVWQALIAFGSGGTTGLGLGNSVQKMFYLPEAHTDFIFPIIGEELGVIFTLAVVFGFLLIALTGGYISYHAPDKTGVLLGVAVTSLICLQAGMNIAVVTALVPAKGIGLPFMSYGGSNLMMCMACVGILLNLHRQANYGNEAPRLTSREEDVWQESA